MSRFATACLATTLLALATTTAPAQNAKSSEQEVRAVVDRLFDAMRAGDSAALRATFHPEARLVSVGRRDGAAALHAESIDAFVRAVGAPRAEVLDERIWDVEVRVDGDLATAWMRYDFYVGEQFSHCGVNAFQLFRSAEGWRVIQIADTRRREGCPEQPR